ncbi:hypothetical protein CJ305_17930 [Leeuwenhoekiella nanhaiensis]|uniref:XRE family transcriptional regulator n=1 Tax=Leeuwenhoekiella nanhaiensis TaxID=1655491 RepID=A0A2G1VM87_9FLAO|nr:hypothetical protein CJ305_17930 [Leeuwenhoekiella nanhaiensis]
MYTDHKMFELLEILKAQGSIRFDKEFCEACDILPQNLSRVRNGDAHFTPDHIRRVCSIFIVNVNWVFGLEEQIFRGVPNVNRKVNPTKSNRPSDNVLN